MKQENVLRINNLKLRPDHSDIQLEHMVKKTLGLKDEYNVVYEIVKRSIDARHKPDIMYVYSVDVKRVSKNGVNMELKKLLKKKNNNILYTQKNIYEFPVRISKGSEISEEKRPVIIGFGPAGMFAALKLSEAGLRPVVYERGDKVEIRQQKVNSFWGGGELDTESNVQFGEGGAGTFSDGKLNTLVKDPLGRNRFVLDTFVSFGAPEKITYENKPHIGTDILSKVIAAMREEILHLGGTFEFESCVTDIRVENQKIKAVEINHNTWMETEVCVLALGHSARDTFEMLHKTGLFMEPKAFAVGFRVEHPQRDINRSQYGEKYAELLEAAPYKVTANLANGRGVYSFCMCPGGYVVNASSEEKRLAVNGMSYSDRGSKNANSAIIVSVTPDDFDGTDALFGVEFQRRLEEKAFALGNGKIPQQLFGDYCENKKSTGYGTFSSETRGETAFSNLRGLFSDEMEQSFIEGMHSFAKHIPEFDRNDAILSGVESRTSSPVRIRRDEAFEANIRGIYPCGEGAGYAGGITSAAMDGMKVAEAVIRKYQPFQ